MKHLITSLLFITSFLFSTSCTQAVEKLVEEVNIVEETIKTVPEMEYLIDEVTQNRENGLWLLKADAMQISGYVVSKFANDSLALRFGVVEGKKEGISVAYYPSGNIRNHENYRNNKLDGEVRRWSEVFSYQLTAVLWYKKGKLHGEQKKWYDTGELFKIRHITMGEEKGMQQAFRRNGTLYVNYEARDGKHYGMKRSMMCVELSDEKIVDNE